MSTQPFQDGFPNQAPAAINASYFLSNEDRNEWFEWLKTADEQQQDELVNILHTMWEDAQRQNSQQNQQSAIQQYDPNPQSNIQDLNSQGNMVQPMANAMTDIETKEPEVVLETESKDEASAFSFKKPLEELSPEPKISKKNLEVNEAYIPSSIISEPDVGDKDLGESEDDFKFDSIEDIAISNTDKISPQDKNYDEDSNLDDEDSYKQTDLEDAPVKKLSSGGIDFVSIRSKTKKDDILSIKDSFINARKEQEISLNDFVEKVSSVIGEFEEVNDYIEAMTDKVLSINDEVISQAQDIQDLKNQTQNRGGSLQDQIDEVKYDVEKILKEIRNIRIEIKRSNDEIRSRLSILEADSFRAENDGINQKLSVIKSELSKLQDAHVSGSQPQTFSEQFKNRSSRLDNIKFQK
jgi:hypothetical protein